MKAKASKGKMWSHNYDNVRLTQLSQNLSHQVDVKRYEKIKPVLY